MTTESFWTATMAGAERWNAVSIPRTLASTTGDADITVTETSFADTSILASMSGYCADGTWINEGPTFTWNTDGHPLDATAKRMVATHELGHAFGLDHVKGNACGGTKSVMIQGQLKWTCNWGMEPWADDIDGVNAIYPSEVTTG